MTCGRSCALVLIALVATACAGRHRVERSDFGIQPCPASAGDHLLSTDALQCWFAAPKGRWRTLSHESHYAVLVVQVESADLRDAEVIAARFVDGHRETFSEILIYVQSEPQNDQRIIRRVRWSNGRGFETLDFGPSAP
jgi:hypothetical protein